MERLARAFSNIQQDMLRNNPRLVTDSVNEVTEVLGGMLNTHKCPRTKGVGKGRPVLRRHFEGNEGEGRPLEGRT